MSKTEFKKIEDLIDGLTISVKEGFDHVEKRFEDIEKSMVTKEDAKNFATKKDVERLSEDIDNLAIATEGNFARMDEKFEQTDERFERIDTRFNDMDRRFDIIENISIGSHERRIENLEDDMRMVKTKTGLGRKS